MSGSRSGSGGGSRKASGGRRPSPEAEVLSPSTATEGWLSLVQEAQRAASRELDEELESYLVFLLMRFTREPGLAASVLALEFLRGLQQAGGLRQASLRDVGDKCLLFTGFFPRRAERRRVRLSYFVDLGRAAYQEAAQHSPPGLGGMYQGLAGAFVALMEVLQAMRRLEGRLGGGEDRLLDPLAAYELWERTGSRAALEALRALTGATAVPGGGEEGPRH